MLAPFIAFLISCLMILCGIVLCGYSVYERRPDEAKKKVKTFMDLVQERHQESVKTFGVDTSKMPQITLDEINKLLQTIIGINDPAFQVGVFLTIFGIIIMILANFINVGF